MGGATLLPFGGVTLRLGGKAFVCDGFLGTLPEMVTGDAVAMTAACSHGVGVTGEAAKTVGTAAICVEAEMGYVCLIIPNVHRSAANVSRALLRLIDCC